MKNGLMDGVESMTAGDIAQMQPRRFWLKGEKEFRQIVEEGTNAVSRQ